MSKTVLEGTVAPMDSGKALVNEKLYLTVQTW